MPPQERKLLLKRTLWLGRLAREGRWDDYWKRHEAIKKSLTGIEGKRAISALQKEFGMRSMQEEFQLHESLMLTIIPNKRREFMAEQARNKGRTGIEKALMDLPSVAPAEQEMAWVRSHPKMTRALMAELMRGPEDEYKPPKPNSADITSVNPPCPSRGAWNTFLSALAAPKKFNEVLLTKQKDSAVKQSDTGTGDDVDVAMDDVDEVRRMLRAAQD